MLEKKFKTSFQLEFKLEIKWNPFTYSKRNNFRKMVKHLRNLAKEKLMARLSAMQNNEPVPNDILGNILKTCSKLFLNKKDKIIIKMIFFNLLKRGR
jgi:hypothetical protein